ncbi:MAG TPA: hypothetical protein VFU42_05595 [Candidatus Deferrimicrobiaceae bacterium]|nr:hypothetical protein [Candidatus Deferrimicrobiaceae bacterium]
MNENPGGGRLTEMGCRMPSAPATATGKGIRLAAKVALFLGFLVFLNYAVSWLANLVAFQMWPRHVTMASYLLFALVVSYVLLLTIPFLPGIEVGLLLMAMLGLKGILLIYFCTIAALSLSFSLGRVLPPRYLARALDWFHLRRARDLVLDLEPLGPEERLRFLLRSAPSRIVPFLLRQRYLIIGILFNLPGNALIGGGGGIGLIAGMSRLFPFPKYLLLVSLAITPGPILFLLRAA